MVFVPMTSLKAVKLTGLLRPASSWQLNHGIHLSLQLLPHAHSCCHTYSGEGSLAPFSPRVRLPSGLTSTNNWATKWCLTDGSRSELPHWWYKDQCVYTQFQLNAHTGKVTAVTSLPYVSTICINQWWFDKNQQWRMTSDDDEGTPFKSWACVIQLLCKHTIMGRYSVQTESRSRPGIGPYGPGNKISQEITVLPQVEKWK